MPSLAQSCHFAAAQLRSVSSATVWIWSTIAGVLAVDVVWLSVSSMSVDWLGIARPVAATGLLGTIAVIYSVTGRSAGISRTAHAAAQWIAFSAVGVVLSYLVTTTRAPLVDHVLLAADLRLGFDWTVWARWLVAHRTVHWLLAVSYWMLFPEVLLCLLWIPLAGSANELLGMLMIAALITIACSGFAPAIGHLPHAPQVAQVIALRAGTMHEIPLSSPEGLIAFPSFHSALALILAYAARRSRWLFPIACAMTIAILISVPSEGGHYLLDVIGGALMVLVTIAALSALAPVVGSARVGSSVRWS